MNDLKIYVGIGSRETPDDILKAMRHIGLALAQKGFTLRSGGAHGADHSFEQGCDQGQGAKEIYLPYKGFNHNPSPLYTPSISAFGLASHYHPYWNTLSAVSKKLMARNSHQVLGGDMKTPADFVVCWTPDGCSSSAERTKKTGGTGQAIDLASDRGIPIFNLFYPQQLFELQKLLNIPPVPHPAKEKNGSGLITMRS